MHQQIIQVTVKRHSGMEMPLKTSVLKTPQQVEILQIQHFFGERYREERLCTSFVFLFLLQAYTGLLFKALKGTEALATPEHLVQPEPSLWRTFQVGLSRLTTTGLSQSVPSTARISLCMPAEHSGVPLVA